MDDEPSAPEWLYYKIYVGIGLARMEHLITRTVPAVVERDAVNRWFFLRYHDDKGPHLRLRLRTRPGASPSVRRGVDHLLHEAIVTFPTLPPSPYRPTILWPPAGVVRPPSTTRSCWIEMDRYEPETDRYGAEGVAVAERLFQASSETAVCVMIDEQEGLYSRKTMIPILMQRTVEALAARDDESAFWEKYARYWLGGAAMAAEWIPRFLAKGRELVTLGVPVLPPVARLPARAREHVCTWARALEEAADAFRGVRDEPRRSGADLAFHFTHLMNNRLGVLPIEESYFATLIHQCSVGAVMP
jgi:thiopeptide-type bacteriocin biosynthesis protein